MKPPADNSDLGFKDDPGAVRHGNFINYYQFHGAEQRLNSIPAQIVRNHLQSLLQGHSESIYALDLGCNTGEITQGLYKILCDFKITDPENIKCLGLDIDPSLIQRANEANETTKNILFEAADLMKVLSDTEKLCKFTNSREKFHLVLCLSLTMWIHLNNGDSGLQLFLKQIAYISDILVVEPQRWKNYKDAVRRMKRGAGIEDAFPHFPKLKWRETVEEDIQSYLESESCNMKLIYKTDPSNWGRKISVYVRNSAKL